MIDTVNASFFRNSVNTSNYSNVPTIPYITNGTNWGGIAISTVDGNYVMTFNTTTGVSFNKRFAMSNMIKNGIDYYYFSVAGSRGTSNTDFKITYSSEDNPTKLTNMVLQVSETSSGSDFIVKFVPATGIDKITNISRDRFISNIISIFSASSSVAAFKNTTNTLLEAGRYHITGYQRMMFSDIIELDSICSPQNLSISFYYSSSSVDITTLNTYTIGLVCRTDPYLFFPIDC